MRFCKNEIVSNPGSPIKITYSPIVKEDGSIILEESGKENTDDFIQSFRESTDMAFILAKLAAGDQSVLNRNVPMFGDFTKMPKTYAEVLQLHIDSDNAFNSLPVEMKKKFDNDANKFFATAGSEEWFRKLDLIRDEAVIEKVKEEVKEEVKE